MTLNLLDSEHVHELSNQMSQFNESYLTFRSGSTTSCDLQDLAFRTFLIFWQNTRRINSTILRLRSEHRKHGMKQHSMDVKRKHLENECFHVVDHEYSGRRVRMKQRRKRETRL